MNETNISFFGNYVTQKGLDCKVDGQKAIHDLLLHTHNVLFYSSVALIILIFLYFVIEFGKKKFTKGINEVDKLLKYMDWFNYIQRMLVLFMFLCACLIIQYTYWGL